MYLEHNEHTTGVREYQSFHFDEDEIPHPGNVLYDEMPPRGDVPYEEMPPQVL